MMSLFVLFAELPEELPPQHLLLHRGAPASLPRSSSKSDGLEALANLVVPAVAAVVVWVVAVTP